MRKQKGFTLSEVLITLTIIGVVAAITVPTLFANYSEQERRSKVKKVYSTLANAMTRVMADGGDMFFESEDGSDENMREFYNTYLKHNLITTKVCYNKSGCWSSGTVKNLDGSNCSGSKPNFGIGGNIITAILNDGTFLNMDAYAPNDVKNTFGVDTVLPALVMHFDINGAKKPNTIGKDIFVTVFTEDGFVPAYKDRTRAEISANCSASGDGISCINKYLHFRSY